MPAEEKVFSVKGFTGRLGMAVTTAMVVTDVPETSVCFGSGIPLGVCVSAVNATRVGSQDELRAALATITNDQPQTLLVTCKLTGQDAEDPARRAWWETIKSTANSNDEDNDYYDPITVPLDLPKIKEECAAYNPEAMPVAPLPQPEAKSVKVVKQVHQQGQKRMWDEEEDEDCDFVPEEAGCGGDVKRVRMEVQSVVPPPPPQQKPPPQTQEWQNLQQVPPPPPQQQQQQKQWTQQHQQQTPPPPPPQPASDDRHPCLAAGPCKLGTTCELAHYPVDACIPFLRSGMCANGAMCTSLHCRATASAPTLYYECRVCALKMERKEDYAWHLRYRSLHIVLHTSFLFSSEGGYSMRGFTNFSGRGSSWYLLSQA